MTPMWTCHLKLNRVRRIQQCKEYAMHRGEICNNHSDSEVVFFFACTPIAGLVFYTRSHGNRLPFTMFKGHFNVFKEK